MNSENFFQNNMKTEEPIAPSSERKFSGKGREYHLRLDNMTGMRKKELLYLPEGAQYLRDKFGDSVDVVLGDMAGMGIGNTMLHSPNENPSESRKNVDECFHLLTRVAGRIFGENIEERPFEIVRVGGDEIIFMTKKDDNRLDELFREYNAEKERMLIDDKIGREAYEDAMLETNIKAEMKIITKEPEYLELIQKGEVDKLMAWLRLQLNSSGNEKRSANLLRALALKKLKLIPVEKWIAPLDFYRSSPKNILLTENFEEDVSNLMDGLAVADADISWIKAHPGATLPEKPFYDSEAISSTASKYLDQARGVEGNIRLIQEKEGQLFSARKDGEKLSVETLKKEIIRLETIDPGTGAIRFDASAEKRIIDLVETTNNNGLQVFRVDIPYFGTYNNNYDYATADEMMKLMTEEFRRSTAGVVVRDGGNLFSLREIGQDEPDLSGIENRLNRILSPYSNPEDLNRKIAIENEVMVKRAISRQTDTFGKVKMFSPKDSSVITKKTKLADVLHEIA